MARGTKKVAGSMITRTHNMALEASCTYSRNARVHSYYRGNVAIVKYVGSSRGTFNFAMALYSSAQYTGAYSQGASVSVGKTVYAKIQFTSAVNLHMYVQDCYAKPTQGSGPYQYDLVGPGGCMKDKTYAPVSKFISNKTYTFQFDAFKFSNSGTSNVFLTCDLYLCKPGQNGKGKCHQPKRCANNKSKRDLTAAHMMKYPITFGPITVN